MRIFFIGFMGCGKSRMGKKLAAKLDRPFIDLDHQMENIFGLTIPQMFEAYGENGFREKERDTLQNPDYDKDIIVSTGGGAPCFFDNMDWMNQNGMTVFIDTPTTALADRLINARVERPLIKGKSYNELIYFIENKMIERRPFYEKAQIILKGVDLTPEMVIEQLGL